MQPDSPYRFTRALGGSLVGKAWAAVDERGRPRTVILLEGPAAADPRWRDAFAHAVRMLMQAPGNHHYAEADLSATNPWVAYEGEQPDVPGQLFRLLQLDYRSEDPAAPVSGPAAPVSGIPVSAGPTGDLAGDDVTGAPAEPTQQIALYSQAPWTAQSSQPISAAPSSAAPAPFDQQFAAPGRRIAPVQVVRRGVNWIWVVVGGLALTLVAGVAGYALGGRGDSDEPPPVTASLSPYQATQLSINKSKFTGELAQMGELWLADVSGCVVYGRGGPALAENEEAHVFCPNGALQVHFSLFREVALKIAGRAQREELGRTANAFAPGVREATRTTGGVTGVPGSYVEYGFLFEGQAYCGVWWDRDDSNAVMVLETPCMAGIAGNWDALRDMWRRHS
ncbi:hypothetical protein [Micromonospora sp. NPDC005203]|uniref:hypothetical protein n=1 Tax=Micromonospora sp. NPDC005203 TaxID=3364226 RepID=UPI0036CF925A